MLVRQEKYDALSERYESEKAYSAALESDLSTARNRKEEYARRLYALLFATEALFKRFGVKPTIWDVPSIVAEMDKLKPGVLQDATVGMDARPAEYTPPEIASLALPSDFDPDGFYSSHSANTLEAFGDFPRWTVANADSDAPPAPASTGEITSTEAAGGGNGTASLPLPVPACNASRETPAARFHFEDYPYTHITPAV